MSDTNDAFFTPLDLEPPKRKVGRPRKVATRPFEPGLTPPTYRDSEWYCWPSPRGDEEQFARLLDEQRTLYSSSDFNSEILVYEDDLTSRSVTPPYGKWSFTAEGLAEYAAIFRKPFTHDGKLTQGGIGRARTLLCRERVLAGTVAPEGRKPDLSRLRDYLGPLLWELMVERA